jgi:uncharacterized membrane protein YhaH (DUF805 family)
VLGFVPFQPIRSKEQNVSFAEAISVCLSKYATFSGRARRSEYWWFALMAGAVNFIAAIVDNVAGTSILAIVAGLALVLPGLAVSIRRLHDTNRSGWWYLLIFVPFGAIALIVFYCQDSAPVANAYGPSPKSLPQSSAAFG